MCPVTELLESLFPVPNACTMMVMVAIVPDVYAVLRSIQLWIWLNAATAFLTAERFSKLLDTISH